MRSELGLILILSLIPVKIDPWFLHQIKELIDHETELSECGIASLDADRLLQLKRHGFSDKRIASLLHIEEEDVTKLRLKWGCFARF